MNNGEWRAYAQRGYHFAHDEIELFIAFNSSVGTTSVVKPFELELEAVNPTVDRQEPWVIDRQLGEALYEALGMTLTGVTEPQKEIERLRQQLRVAEARLDKLISGIGQLGGYERQPK
jgi:hypothetical protein